MPKTELTASEVQPKVAAQPITAMAVVAPVLGWLIPGAGHFIQGKWGRGLLLMFSVVLMFLLGIAMAGKIYKYNTGDLLDMLGFVGDAGAGGLYIISRVMEWGSSAIAYATADYGTKYIVISGLLNVMSMVDAYHIAMGRKK
jgi:TM2 domain-containing membrane protein YozV